MFTRGFITLIVSEKNSFINFEVMSEDFRKIIVHTIYEFKFVKIKKRREIIRVFIIILKKSVYV